MSVQLIFNYFPELSQIQKKQFTDLESVYKEWNEKINVISRKDIDQLYTRHVLHSLAIAKITRFPAGSRVLDIGTGGGFPGIPLAILHPESDFLLVDSIGKKIKVVNEVITALELKNVSALHQRAEKAKGPFDFIVSRAVAKTKSLLHWTHQKINRSANESIDNGYFLLKGGDLEEELNEVKRPYQETNISDFFDDPFFDTKKVIYIPI